MYDEGTSLAVTEAARLFGSIATAARRVSGLEHRAPLAALVAIT